MGASNFVLKIDLKVQVSFEKLVLVTRYDVSGCWCKNIN